MKTRGGLGGPDDDECLVTPSVVLHHPPPSVIAATPPAETAGWGTSSQLKPGTAASHIVHACAPPAPLLPQSCVLLVPAEHCQQRAALVHGQLQPLNAHAPSAPPCAERPRGTHSHLPRQRNKRPEPAVNPRRALLALPVLVHALQPAQHAKGSLGAQRHCGQRRRGCCPWRTLRRGLPAASSRKSTWSPGS